MVLLLLLTFLWHIVPLYTSYKEVFKSNDMFSV